MTTLKIGDVVDVEDKDYKYGTGTLILRISMIGDRRHTADGEWIDLDGFELLPDGTQLGPQPRRAAVRVNAIRVRPGTE